MAWIALRVADLYKKDSPPTPAGIDALIRELIQGGVLTGDLDREQIPVDIYGTRFRVRHRVDGRQHTIAATSAGPDRRFDKPTTSAARTPGRR